MSIRVGALIVAAAVALTFLLHRAAEAPDRPQPIAWDHEACAQCKMLIGEAGFAAQIVDEDGRAFDFDDPGCLLAYLATHTVRSHRVWFHDLTGDRWLGAGEVGFVEVPRSPMGYGLGAVAAGVPGALSYDAAAARVRRAP
jgi:copper chaperone NosL